jgi:hypothetical protein
MMMVLLWQCKCIFGTFESRHASLYSSTNTVYYLYTALQQDSHNVEMNQTTISFHFLHIHSAIHQCYHNKVQPR